MTSPAEAQAQRALHHGALVASLGTTLLLSCGTPEVIPRPCETCPMMATIDQCFVPLEVSSDEYAERLRGMWLGENIANWTGLLTEFQRKQAPFYRDEDWGTDQGRRLDEGSSQGRIELNFLDPWGADDDTDIEFMYMRAMTEAGTTHLTPSDIRDAWRTHILPDIYVWVSNAQARNLFDASPVVMPPSTGFIAANDQAWMIDAQLTTELFGALSPGRPAHALQLADLPMRTTASGHALHAAQFYAVLYSLASVVRQDLSPEEQIDCLVLGARELIPSTSKARDVIDFVIEAHHRHPSDWETARDAIALRYQSEDEASGFTYLEWYESSVNLAGGLLALLYGHGDLVRTIQVGALSGWDSDNGTATMGGLLGLMHGEAWVREEIARTSTRTLSSDYRIARTRVNFPDDVVTLTEISDELIPLVEDAVMETGGSVSDGWLRNARVTPLELDVAANPHTAWLERGLLQHLQSLGERITITSTAATSGAPLDFLRDPPDLDPSGRDRDLDLRDEAELRTRPATSHHIVITSESDTEVALTLAWPTPQRIAGVRLIEGPLPMHLVRIETHDARGWHALETALPTDNLGRAFEVFDLPLAEDITTDALRVITTPGSAGASFAAIDGLLPRE